MELCRLLGEDYLKATPIQQSDFAIQHPYRKSY